MANSSSTDERVDFTFYVPKAKRLIPLRLSNNSLEDFKRALNEANCVDDFREEVERTFSQSYRVVLITEQQDSSIETCVYQSCNDGLTTTGVGTESSINRELKQQAFLRTRTWGDRVETKSKTPFLAPIFVLSTRLPATDAAAKFKKYKRQCKHWFSRGNLRIRLSFSLHGVF